MLTTVQRPLQGMTYVAVFTVVNAAAKPTKSTCTKCDCDQLGLV